MVLGSGCAYAWTALAAALLADQLAVGALLAGLAWLAAIGAAALLGLVAEMSALQHRAAIAVAPTVFVVQVAVPVAVAPLIGQSWAASTAGGFVLIGAMLAVIGGAVALMRSPAVATLIASAAPERVDGDGPQPPVAELQHQRA